MPDRPSAVKYTLANPRLTAGPAGRAKLAVLSGMAGYAHAVGVAVAGSAHAVGVAVKRTYANRALSTSPNAGTVSRNLGTSGRIGTALALALVDSFSPESAVSAGNRVCLPALRAIHDLHFPSGGFWPRKLTVSHAAGGNCESRRPAF